MSPIQKRIVGTAYTTNDTTNDKWYFATSNALTTAYPTWVAGWFAIVGSTDTVWTWDTWTNAWVDTWTTLTTFVPYTWATGDVNLGVRNISAGQVTSTVATGTAPLVVASTTQVANLNSASSGKSTNLTGGNTTTLLGSTPYQSGVDTTTMLVPNTSATLAVLTQTGTGTNGAAPVWTNTTGTGNIVRATWPTFTWAITLPWDSNLINLRWADGNWGMQSGIWPSLFTAHFGGNGIQLRSGGYIEFGQSGQSNFGVAQTSGDTWVRGTLTTSAGFDSSKVTTGTYTPTATNIANTDGRTPTLFYYTRVGNNVNVWGAVSIDPTTTLTTTQINLTLPIASTLASYNLLSGTAGGTVTGVNQDGSCYADTSLNLCRVYIPLVVSTTGQNWLISFSYPII